MLVSVSPLALGQVNQEIDQDEDLLAVDSIDNEVGTVGYTSLPAAISRDNCIRQGGSGVRWGLLFFISCLLPASHPSTSSIIFKNWRQVGDSTKSSC